MALLPPLTYGLRSRSCELTRIQQFEHCALADRRVDDLQFLKRLGFVLLPQLFHKGIRVFSKFVSVATRPVLAISVKLVVGIVFVRSLAQMGRIAASRVIAFVQHQKVRIYSSVMLLISKARSCYEFAIYIKSAITAALSALPFPAFVGSPLLDPRPKPFSQRWAHGPSTLTYSVQELFSVLFKHSDNWLTYLGKEHK